MRVGGGNGVLLDNEYSLSEEVFEYSYTVGLWDEHDDYMDLKSNSTNEFVYRSDRIDCWMGFVVQHEKLKSGK